MPFAQWGYPWVEGSKEKFEQHYPADFIAEAIDQTRGWFYTMMAVGTLVFEESSYKNVVCLGHILAEDGRKMSKHLGNILLPIPLMDTHGADSLRWFMAAGGSPWAARRVGDTTLQEIIRKVLLTYWNTVAFHALYARTNKWSPVGTAPEMAQRHILDRWLSSATQILVREVTESLEKYDTLRVGALLSEFIDDMSNWYVRRSRRRFWDGEASALWTLHETIDIVTRLMAPIAPFITEQVWQDLIVATDSSQPTSVHLAKWPVADESIIDISLQERMATTRRLVELGRSARAESKIKIRQPLSRLLVPSAAFAQLDEALLAEVTSELNVLSVESFAGAGELVDYSAKGNFRALGKRFGKETPIIANKIAAADAAVLAATLATEGKATVDGVEVLADEVLISERPREGWSVVSETGETVALDLELTPELVKAGLAREAIRLVQETRKNTGLDVSDRIVLQWAAEADVAAALREHSQLIADEVLAVSISEAVVQSDWVKDEDLGLSVKVAKA